MGINENKYVFRSSCRKWFEPTTTESRLDALSCWAIKPWAQIALSANFLHQLQFYLFVLCSRFVSAIAFASRNICFKKNLAQVMTLIAKWIDTYSIHHWMIFRSSYRKLAKKEIVNELEPKKVGIWLRRLDKI